MTTTAADGALDLTFEGTLRILEAIGASCAAAT